MTFKQHVDPMCLCVNGGKEKRMRHGQLFTFQMLSAAAKTWREELSEKWADSTAGLLISVKQTANVLLSQLAIHKL